LVGNGSSSATVSANRRQTTGQPLGTVGVRISAELSLERCRPWFFLRVGVRVGAVVVTQRLSKNVFTCSFQNVPSILRWKIQRDELSSYSPTGSRQ
jgi:hypothetical protein